MRARRAQQEKLHNIVYDILLNNLLTVMYVLHEDYGFGAKRSEEFISHLMEAVVKFDQHARSDTMELVVEDINSYRQNLREILRITTKPYLPEEMYRQIFNQALPTTASLNSKYKNAERQEALTMAEAAKLTERLDIYRDWLKEQNNENTNV